jgi:hypothetical protein
MDALQNPVVLSEVQRQRLREELTRMASMRGQPLNQTIEAVNSAFGDGERGQIVLEFAGAAMEQLERQCRELLGPIDARERRVLTELRANYAETMGIQSAVRAYLQSVHAVQVEQDEVLRRLNLLRTRDSVIAGAIVLNDAVVKRTDQAGDAEAALRQIRAKLGIPTPSAPAPTETRPPDE